MTLSPKGINRLAQAITPDVIDFLIQSDFLLDTAPAYIEAGIKDLLGEVDPDLLAEVSINVYERIVLTHLE